MQLGAVPENTIFEATTRVEFEDEALRLELQSRVLSVSAITKTMDELVVSSLVV